MIIFETPGLIDIRSFTTMGLSVKPASTNPIGYFGTGLKYAVAVLVRLGAEVVVWIGRDEYRFTKEQGDFRGAAYDKLVMRAKRRSWRNWRAIDLPYTTQYGRNWQTWQAFRELEANTRDEGGTTKQWEDDADVRGIDGVTQIVVTLPAFDEAYAKRAEIFLPDAVRTGTGVQVLDAATSSIYWRGLKAYEMGKPGVHTYNFLDHVDLTEDRTLKSEWSAKYALGYWLIKCEDEAIIESIITVGEDRWEHEIDYPNNVAPSAAFHQVMMRHPKRVNAGAWGYYSRHDPRPTPKTFDAWEAHPRPWRMQGDGVVDAKGRTVFDAPYGYQGRWDLVAQAILQRINPVQDAAQPVPDGAAAEQAPDPYTKPCPNCGEAAAYEVVDIGVGNQQCAPAHYEACNWVEPTPEPATADEGDIPF